MTLGVRDVTFDDACTFSWRDVAFGHTFSPLEHDVMAFGGFYTTSVTFSENVLMCLCYIFMLEAILGVDLDLSTFYHRYFKLLGAFEG
jgi:hypothetical protein